MVNGMRMIGKADVSRKLESQTRLPPWMKYRRITSGPPHVPMAKRIEFSIRRSFFMLLFSFSSFFSWLILSTMVA